MNLLRRSVDPVLVVSFLFSAVTGLLMFLHVRSFLIKELHEISSLLFLVAGSLHLYFNLKPFTARLRQRASLIALIVTLLLLSGIALHLTGQGSRPRPQGIATPESPRP